MNCIFSHFLLILLTSYLLEPFIMSGLSGKTQNVLRLLPEMLNQYPVNCEVAINTYNHYTISSILESSEILSSLLLVPDLN